jgi:hypothetical protein
VQIRSASLRIDMFGARSAASSLGSAIPFFSTSGLRSRRSDIHNPAVIHRQEVPIFPDQFRQYHLPRIAAGY